VAVNLACRQANSGIHARSIQRRLVLARRVSGVGLELAERFVDAVEPNCILVMAVMWTSEHPANAWMRERCVSARHFGNHFRDPVDSTLRHRFSAARNDRKAKSDRRSALARSHRCGPSKRIVGEPSPVARDSVAAFVLFSCCEV
jgi:hypothetical protein